MSLPLLLIFGAALGGWALLRCIGNECDRRIRLIEERVRVEQEAEKALAAAKAANQAAAAALEALNARRPGLGKQAAAGAERK